MEKILEKFRNKSHSKIDNTHTHTHMYKRHEEKKKKKRLVTDKSIVMNAPSNLDGPCTTGLAAAVVEGGGTRRAYVSSSVQCPLPQRSFSAIHEIKEEKSLR
jgi:predicted neutral ceramidase superfamily lipid hydrolase